MTIYSEVLIMLYKVVYESVDEILNCVQVIKSYWAVNFPVVQFIMLYKVVLM